jgi:predicted Zn-dependent protease
MFGVIRTRAILLMVMAMMLMPVSGRDAAAAKLIRDTEIENNIRTFATPLFEAAGLRSQDVRIFIIADGTLNAFVAGGLNLFFNTGLLLRASNLNELQGIIAHETGHMEGGHLTRISGRLRAGSNAALVATILGGLAAALGSPDLGAAIIGGGQGLVAGSILGFSRAQESAADQAGLRLLDATGQSAQGMRDFFKTLEDQELLPAHRQDAYVRTHPITRNRIRDVESHLKRSRFSNAKPDPKLTRSFRRMQAKLAAFLYPPERTFNTYADTDNSVNARYARAIAYYRQNDLNRALPILDGLIADEPKNAYFYELKGQALLEAGRIKPALAPYENAVRIEPGAVLIRIDLARTQLALNDPSLVKKALSNLLFATNKSPEISSAWHHLAVAYGRDGQFGMSSLALAERDLLRGKLRDALFNVGRAEKKLKKGSTGWTRAQDVKRLARERLRKRKGRRR